MVRETTGIHTGMHVARRTQITAMPTGLPVRNLGTTELSAGLIRQTIVRIINPMPTSATVIAVLSFQNLLMFFSSNS